MPRSFLMLEDSFLWMTTKPSSKVAFSRLKELLREPLNPTQTQFFTFKNSAIYSPIGYLPQSLGLLLGRQLAFSLLGQFYLGRIFNVLIWIALTYTSIHLLPVHKWAMFVIALMPMTITQAASYSIDSILNGLSFLFIALVIRAACNESVKPVWRDFILWIILLSLITLSKSAYVLLAGLLLIIPLKKFMPWKKFILVMAIIIGIPLVTYMAWIKLLTNSGINLSVGEQFNPGLQIQWIFGNILPYSKLLILNYVRMALPLMVSCIGYLGWLNQPLPSNAYPTFVLFIFLTFILDHNYTRIRVLPWQRIGIVGVVAACMLTIATSIFVISNPVAYYRIDGIQGRYFIPLVPLIGLLIYNNTIRIPGWTLKLFVPLGSIWFMVLAVLTVLQRIQFY